MKNRIITLFLTVIMLFTTIFTVNAVEIRHIDSKGKVTKLTDFLDTKGHWAHDTILKCAEYGLVAGNNGYYMPDKPIKRGDLCIILDRMFALETTAYNNFNDLPNDSYYRDAVLRCVAAGYVAGTSANTVSPEGFATREQVAVIMCRILKIDTFSSYTSFVDDSQIGAWAKPSVAAMKRLGYMVGNNANQFKPKSNITRAELITMLNNIANTFIPRKDDTGLGNTFKSNFPTNLVTGKDVILNHSTVGRDIVLTYDANALTLNDTNVLGRILVMNKININLKNSSVSQIYLNEGKSTIKGLSEDVKEVYIAEYASESILDGFPECIVLEPGVRVQVAGEMYENEGLTTKVYYGSELKADIADEQGFIVGGPKVKGTKFYQYYDNKIVAENVQIIEGESNVKEIGIVWLEQDEDKEIINPTYQNCDGKTVLDIDKISEPLEIEVGTVRGMRAYRIYVKDSEGLFAYSTASVFTAYDYDMTLRVYDNDYPEKMDVEMVFKGENIPDITSIRIVHDVSPLYSEEHSEVGMKLYKEVDVENPVDSKNYQRYTATIISKRERNESGEYETLPSTAFGYIIKFRDGSLVNRFPVLTDALPEGVSPMSELKTGSGGYTSSGDIKVSRNIITTRYVLPQEVGIVYKTSSASSVSTPSVNANGWTRIPANLDISVNESASFDSYIDVNTTEGNTFYAVYVKTHLGYWYGDVRSIANNSQGDEDGYKIKSVVAEVLGDGEVLFTLETTGDKVSSIATISMGDDIGLKLLSDLEMKSYENKIYFVLRDLDLNTTYNLPIRLYTPEGAKSNVMTVSFTTNTSGNVVFESTRGDGENYFFNCKVNGSGVGFRVYSCILENSNARVTIKSANQISVPKTVNLAGERVNLILRHYVAGNEDVYHTFTTSVPLS